ncbi:MAG: PorV/PorQ family protein [FCB group bacterium]|nr:PorV/PorQ family protein [FCB group bacterium]
MTFYKKLVFLSFLFLTLVSLVLPLNAKNINSHAGTSAFPFLKINLGARAVAMGGAFTGLANDESAMYYNPAGITNFENKRFILGYHNYFVDIQNGFIGYISPLGFNKAIGVYASYLNYGDFTETDQFGNTMGTFSGGDLLLATTFAMKKGYYFSFGATAKFIYEKLQDFSATGLAMDIGAKYTADRNRYSAGIMLQNIGFQLSSLGDKKDKLPFTIRGGFAYNPIGLPLTLVSDVLIPIDNDPVFAIGGEYYEFKPFYIRIGWNSFGSNFRGGYSDDSWAGMSLGFGLDIKKMQISYSFSPAADLGESHRVTITGGL